MILLLKIKHSTKALIALICVLCFTFASLCFPSASATRASMIWGSGYWQSDMEAGYEQQTCADINSYFATYDFWSWQPMNGYGYPGTSGTNVYNDYGNIQGNPSYDYVATFHVGNYYPSTTSGTVHYNYCGYDGPSNGIHEALNIYPGWSKCIFTFIYTCADANLFWRYDQYGNVITDPANANLYGYTDWQNGTGWVGMAYAWLRGQSYSTNGYASPDYSGYCYISFQGRDRDLSQRFEYEAWGGDVTYKTFVDYFYIYLCCGYPVNSCLDYATYYSTGGAASSFSQLSLCNGYSDGWDSSTSTWSQPGQMRVYGDGSLVLPRW